MANIQLENGYFRIANELWDELMRIRIPGEAWQVLAVIIRQTYGWNKTKDRIPLSRFVDMTGLPQRSVTRGLNKLSTMGLILRSPDPKGTEYAFLKDHDLWKPLPKRGAGSKKTLGQRGVQTRVKKAYEAGSKRTHSKDTIKNTSKDIVESEIPFADIIADLNQKSGKSFKPSTEATRRAIAARWREGYRLPDFQAVHSTKCEEWLGTEYEKYLRPNTLYRPSHFESYLNQSCNQRREPGGKGPLDYFHKKEART